MRYVAAIALERLAKDFLAGVAEWGGMGRLPRSLDEISFACVLIAEEWHDYLSAEDIVCVAECREAVAQNSDIAWLDTLAWDLAESLCPEGETALAEGLPGIASNLAHGNSSIRGYYHELAWFVRSHFDKNELTPILLQNAGDKLGYWDLSLGLCASLFADPGQFWNAADAFQCDGGFDDQYRDRLKLVRDASLGLCLAPFYELECRLRKIIEEIAMPIWLGREDQSGQLSLF